SLLDCLFYAIPARPSSPRLPYTTLFRSWLGLRMDGALVPGETGRRAIRDSAFPGHAGGIHGAGGAVRKLGDSAFRHADGAAGHRSEEHTSELQSRENLVCRLLLEKKNHI